jgi:hypothetical protein
MVAGAVVDAIADARNRGPVRSLALETVDEFAVVDRDFEPCPSLDGLGCDRACPARGGGGSPKFGE